MTTPQQNCQYRALIELLGALAAQPIATHNPLALLRPRFDGSMTIAVALSPAIREAIAACEQLAYQRDGKGRSLCDRRNDLPAILAIPASDGW